MHDAHETELDTALEAALGTLPGTCCWTYQTKMVDATR